MAPRLRRWSWFLRAGGADHLGAEGGRDLHREVAHPAGGGVHEDPLAGLDLKGLHERLVGGHPGQRDRGGLVEGQAPRLARDGALRRGHELGRRTELHVVAADVAVHLVADLEAGDDGRADRFHDTRDVPARDDRQVVRERALEVALADLPVHRVHAGRLHPHQDGVRAHGRVVDLADLEDVGVPELVVHGCTHAEFLPHADVCLLGTRREARTVFLDRDASKVTFAGQAPG